jgi:quercetin dioxygenase-like cupin family protein
MCKDRPSMIGVVLLATAVSGWASAESMVLGSPIKIETLIQSTSAWDATPYRRYPDGQPLISVLRITIAPDTVLDWHSHPMPNAAYVLSGELTLERKDGTRKRFFAGQALTETVNRIHRGLTGETPVVLIVFYAGVPGLPLSQAGSR